jgi:hypothetical protein
VFKVSQTSDVTCLYVQVVDPRCINFVSCEDYESIVAKEYRIPIYKCLLERLKVDGFIWHVHISNMKILLWIFSTLYIAKSMSFGNIF